MAHKQLSNAFLGSQIDVIMKESGRKNIITLGRIDGKEQFAEHCTGIAEVAVDSNLV